MHLAGSCCCAKCSQPKSSWDEPASACQLRILPSR
jgi:hypothetical protein